MTTSKISVSYLPHPNTLSPLHQEGSGSGSAGWGDEGCCHLVGFCQAEKKTLLKNSASDQRMWRHRFEVYGKRKTVFRGWLSIRSTQSIYLLALRDLMSLCQEFLGGRNTLSKIHPGGFFAPAFGPGLLTCFHFGMQRQGLDLVVILGPFPLSTFCDSILWFCSVVPGVSTQLQKWWRVRFIFLPLQNSCSYLSCRGTFPVAPAHHYSLRHEGTFAVSIKVKKGYSYAGSWRNPICQPHGNEKLNSNSNHHNRISPFFL